MKASYKDMRKDPCSALISLCMGGQSAKGETNQITKPQVLDFKIEDFKDFKDFKIEEQKSVLFSSSLDCTGGRGQPGLLYVRRLRSVNQQLRHMASAIKKSVVLQFIFMRRMVEAGCLERDTRVR